MYYQCAETREGTGIHDHVQNVGNKAGVESEVEVSLEGLRNGLPQTS